MSARKILQLLSKQPRLTPMMLAQQLRLSPQYVRNTLAVMLDLGLVVTPVRGVYEIAPLGLEVADKSKPKA